MLRPHLTPSPRSIFVCSLVLVAVVLAAVVLLVPGIALAADDLTTAADSMPIVGGAAIGSSAIASFYTWVSARERVLKHDHEKALMRLEDAFNRSLLDLSRGIADLGKRVARNRGDIEDRIQEAEDRLSRLEEASKHAPTAAQLTELLRLIGDLRADVKAQSVEMSGLSTSVRAELGALSRRFDNYETHMLEARK